MKRRGIVLIGLGPGSQPHLKSLQDLRADVDLRWAICRHPHEAERSFLPASLQVTADLNQALSDPEVDMAIVAGAAEKRRAGIGVRNHRDVSGRCRDNRDHRSARHSCAERG